MLTLSSLDVWGGVTNPAEHNPASFRYLVHGDSGQLDPNQTESFGRRCFVNRLGRAVTSITELTRISCSLIDERRHAIHKRASHGLILNVPSSCVVATSPSDMYSYSLSSAEAKQKHPIVKSPEELLAATLEYENNEVLVRPDQVAIVGLFAVPERLPNSKLRICIDEHGRIANQRSLPLITL